MPKKKCPACGSNDTTKILYGLPTYEAFEASERGEFILGGCCVSDISPTIHCKTCGQDFNGRDLFSIFEITSLEIFVGGYFGTSHYIYVDGKQNDKNIKYAKVPGGIIVDLKNLNFEEKNHIDVFLKEILLTPEEWVAFINDLAKLEISCWKEHYFSEKVLDGTQWEVIIKLKDHQKIHKYGSNEYPPYWNKFIKTISKYIDEKID